jgi:hypothetical protein
MAGETYMDTDNDVQKGLQTVKRNLAVQEATQAGALATLAATQAGVATTTAAAQVGMAAAVVAGAGAFVVGTFLGLAINKSR